MFNGGDVIEFFNRIINTPELGDEEVKENVSKFYNYLCLTKMCSEEALKQLYKIVNCISEIIVIRKEIGYFDVKTLLFPKKPEDNKEVSTEAKAKPVAKQPAVQQPKQEKKEPDKGKKLAKTLSKPKPKKKPSQSEERHYSYFSSSGKSGCGGESTNVTPKNWAWPDYSSSKTC